MFIEEAVTKIETQSTSITSAATALTVTNQASLDKANSLLGAIKGLRAQIATTFDPIVQKAHAAHKEALAQKKKLDSPLNTAESIVKSTMSRYLDEVEAKRKAEEAIVEAKRKVELDKAEAKRKENEETAAAMQDAGLGDLVFQEPIVPDTVFQEHIPQPKMEGSHSQHRWHAEVTDMRELLKAIIASVAHAEAVIPNMIYLNGLARARKAEGELIPGVKAVSERSISHKSG